MANNEESLQMLNIKRGILTSLQTKTVSETMKRSFGGYAFSYENSERDVTGDCQTQYRVIPDQKSIGVYKSRDFSNCLYRPVKITLSNNKVAPNHVQSSLAGKKYY